MSDAVKRVHGPLSDGPRYRWKPRLFSSDAVRHSSTTDLSPALAENDCSFTSVVASRSSAPRSQAAPAGRRWPSMSNPKAGDRSSPVSSATLAPAFRWMFAPATPDETNSAEAAACWGLVK